ncbi:hypothetical protein [Haladaptatus halobius]|uniref:hypothetical protein n=1 Tax=Haladaptatus halobius TaxID=2884875 RepID=UPI001D09A571|nr:hypothetical protein [Haladaptatus halobius]
MRNGVSARPKPESSILDGSFRRSEPQSTKFGQTRRSIGNPNPDGDSDEYELRDYERRQFEPCEVGDETLRRLVDGRGQKRSEQECEVLNVAVKKGLYRISEEVTEITDGERSSRQPSISATGDVPDTAEYQHRGQKRVRKRPPRREERERPREGLVDEVGKLGADGEVINNDESDVIALLDSDGNEVATSDDQSTTTTTSEETSTTNENTTTSDESEETTTQTDSDAGESNASESDDTDDSGTASCQNDSGSDDC